MVSEQSGYRDWLIDSVIATQWARSQEGVEPDRFAFFGTSQGGMGAALLASAYYQKGAAALMAEQPFAADFKVSMALDDPVNYLNNRVYTDITDMDNPSEGFRRIGFIDLTSHVHRIDVPTLLALGDKDVLCPAESIRSFYDKLSTTKALLEIKGQEHGFTNIFVQQALAWAKCHV